MIRALNAFQLVLLFACMPFIIGWLHSEPFAYSTSAKWVAIIGYLILFGVHVVGVYELCEKEKR